MSYSNSIYAIDRERFEALMTSSGLGELVEAMNDLIAHGVLVPLSVEGKSERHFFYVLQLFTLCRYAACTRTYAHPWAKEEAHRERTAKELKELTARARDMTELIDWLRGESRGAHSRDRIADLFHDVELLLETLQPGDVLQHIIEAMRVEAVAALRGEARLYGELFWGLQRLRELYHSALLTSPAEEQREGETRETQDMEAFDLSMGQASPSQARPIVSTRVTMEMNAFQASQQGKKGAKEAPSYAPQEDQEGRGGAPERRESPAEERTNPFVRVQSPLAPAVSDLQKRLDALKQDTSSGGRPSSLAQKAMAISKPDEVTEEFESMAEGSPVPSQERGMKEDATQSEIKALTVEDATRDVEEIDVTISEAEEIEVEGGDDLLIDLSEEAPLLLDDDEIEDDLFDEESKTMVLDGRELKARAQADATDSGPPSDVEALIEPEEHGEEDLDEAEWQRQIEELNAKRETYMQEQNWSGLVDLYEEGIDLFEADARQQVYLTLAKLYELKMQDSKRALENMARAFELGGADPLLLKIVEALARLGQGPTRPALAAWIEAQLGTGQWTFEVTESLQRLRATLLKDHGDNQRGFLMYASFVADDPERAATDDGLDFLESLADGIQAVELYDLYDDLIEHTLDQTLLYHLNSRAGFFALQRDDLDRATPYLERALEIDPAQEKLFHVLAQLYEEEGRKSELLVLHERRMRAVTGSAREAIAERLAHLREDEKAHTEEYLSAYVEKLERSPQDDVLLECIMRIYLSNDRHIDGYAFLNRHLDKLSAVASRVRARQTLATLALQHLHSPEEALMHLEEALELGGARKKLLENLITISLEEEDWLKVMRYIERLTQELFVELDHEERVRWLLAGAQAAQSLDDMTKERHFLERTIAIDPHHEQAKMALADLS